MPNSNANRLADLAIASAAKKYGKALRDGFLSQAIYDELVVAEAAHVVAAQDSEKYAAGAAIINRAIEETA